jgi:hypothetical protein
VGVGSIASAEAVLRGDTLVGGSVLLETVVLGRLVGSGVITVGAAGGGTGGLASLGSLDVRVGSITVWSAVTLRPIGEYVGRR